MSIALSAVIKPSRLLFVLVVVECTLVGLIGALIACGIVGNLLLPERLALATLCVLAAAYGMLRYYRDRRTIQIDVSGTGQIQIAEIAKPVAINANQVSAPMLMPAQLLQGTTIWSHLLLLRLRLASGSVRTIAILPDCVSKDSFRVLSVACRWIAAHANRKNGADKAGVTGLANE
ncbi:flagellar hook-length control protein [Collimonas arenae]|uniref:flagellar hook-length control protein n=1 Tax=Collimonas arenae TaxID=279058 RepID=UPI00209EC7B8|nr:flagellar hook-length control protein [Collimonas arenae]